MVLVVQIYKDDRHLICISMVSNIFRLSGLELSCPSKKHMPFKNMKDEYHVSYQWDMRDRSLLKQQLMR